MNTRRIGAALCVLGALLLAAMAGATPAGAVTKPKTVPGKPVGLGATALNGAFLMTWRAPTSAGGSPITGYTVVATASHEPARSCSTSGALSCVVAPVALAGGTYGNLYKFSIVATNSFGKGKADKSSGSDAPVAHCTYLDPYADLAGCNLTGVSLAGLDLSDAVLTGAQLIAANLTGADLTGVNLSSAALNDATLASADLTNADLTGAVLSYATVTGSTLTGATLTQVTTGSLTGVPATLPTHWALVGGTLFGPAANLSQSTYSGLDLAGLDLAGADLSQSDLSTANLAGVNFTGANFSHAAFDGATVTGAIVTSVLWFNTSCPDSTNSNAHTPQTCVGDGF